MIRDYGEIYLKGRKSGKFHSSSLFLWPFCLRGLSSLLVLLLVCPPQFAWGSDKGFEIERKKYVRQPSEPPSTRPRRVNPRPNLPNPPNPIDARAKLKPIAPLLQEKEPATPGPLVRKGLENKGLETGKGPDIRIALATDAGVVSVASNRPIDYYNSGEQEFVTLAARQVKAQLASGSVRERPGRIYRVQVASLKTSREADLLVRRLRQRFAEPVKVNFDRDASSYDVTVGEFSSQRDAQAFMVRVMNAGYRQTWVAKDERGGASRGALLKVLSADGEQLAAVGERLILASQDEENAPLRYNGNAYRGRFELFINKRGRLTVINVLPMEDYVRGVVPNELSPTGFPMLEALKAQAVAARSYALHNHGQFESEGFDLLPNALSQVYGGMSSEHQLSDQAVRETWGMVAIYNGQPINALYTSTCGGRTESSEFVFNEPVPYLVSVACEPQHRERRVERGREPNVERGRESNNERGPGSNAERESKDQLVSHSLKTVRRAEPILGESGRAITREMAALDILQFSLPENPPASYFLATASQKEVVKWVTRAAEVIGRAEPVAPKDATSLTGFASLLTTALYGEDRPSALLSPADADYLLGDDAEDIPTRSRTEVAALLQEGILSPNPDGSLHPRAAITRGTALLAITRALAKFGQPVLESGTARPVEGHRLKIRTAKSKEPIEFELAKDFYLFRFVNNEAFPATSIQIIGGEKVNYHLDGKGRIDYIEVQPNPNGAASDRFSAYSRWQVRFTATEIRSRLAEANVNVGGILDLQGTKYGYSHRLAELKVIGTEGERSLTGLRIRSALGLRESLFIILREYDAHGRVSAFRFLGRGWGHGVGMCQVGAYGLALEGLDYQEILKTYYSGIELTKYY